MTLETLENLVFIFVGWAFTAGAFWYFGYKTGQYDKKKDEEE
jgi:hypothetical protein